jgi:rod shape-determining protein MreC
MAPPGNRRPAIRAGRNIFFAYVAAGVGAVVGGCCCFHRWAARQFRGSAQCGQRCDATCGQIVGAGTFGAGDTWGVLSGYFTSGAENARLKKEVALAGFGGRNGRPATGK